MLFRSRSPIIVLALTLSICILIGGSPLDSATPQTQARDLGAALSLPDRTRAPEAGLLAPAPLKPLGGAELQSDLDWTTFPERFARNEASVGLPAVQPGEPAANGTAIDLGADIYDDIVLHDLLVGEDVAVSTYPSFKWSPTVYGDRVVWDDGRNGVGNHDIYVYNYGSGVEMQVTTDLHDQTAPAIYGDRIVYIDNRSGNEDIYMYDLSSNTETAICDDPARQISPAIYGDYVAWMDYRNGANPDVYMYNILSGEETQVVEHVEYYSPSFEGGGYISIYEDLIVWHDWRNGNADVFMYDITTGVETQITTNTLDQSFPDIYGDIIVWEDNRNSPLPFDPDTEQKDIYMYNLTTETESPVSEDPEDVEKLPAIYGDRIVWTRGEDVLMYELPGGPETVVGPGAGVLSFPDIHGHRIVWVGPSPTEPYVKLLFVPLNWTRTQVDFNSEVETQVGFFLDAIPLSACPTRLSATPLNVDTQNFNTFTCVRGHGSIATGDIRTFVESLGINTADYTAIVGMVDASPCCCTVGQSNGSDIVWVTTTWDSVTAHELGHIYGLEDEYQSNPAGCTDCRCNDGDMGPVAWWDDCDDLGGDGAATGDVNWLDADLGCAPDGACCTDPVLGNDCSDPYSEVCCWGNQNEDDPSGRCVMSFADAPDPRGFCTHCRAHLATVAELHCDSPEQPVSDQVIDVVLNVHPDDTVEEESVILRRGQPSTDHVRGGEYRLDVTGSEGLELMWSQDFNIYFDYYGPVVSGCDYSSILYDPFSISRKIPYDPAMEELRLYHGQDLLYSRVLNFCNQDGTCDPSETYLTCPADCPLNERDGICLPNEDGVCDPDCEWGVDPDCGPELIYIKPGVVTLEVSEVFSVAVRVDEIEDLYGVQLALSFDPEVVEVVDADPFMPGVQIETGSFLNPDVVPRNLASNTEGTIEYTASLTGVKPGVSGSGTLAWIGLHGVNPGRSPVAFTTVVLGDPQSVAIEVDRYDGVVVVQGAAEAPFTVTGQVELERRTSNAGAQVCVDDNCATTDETGNYTLPGVQVGQEVEVAHPSYLRSARTLSDPPTTVGGTVTLPDVTLLGGDVDQDDRIYNNDAALVGAAMIAEPVDEPWYRVRDITDDGVVNVLDFVAVQFNWDTRAPAPWPGTFEAHVTDAGATNDDEERGSPSLWGHMQALSLSDRTRAAPKGILGWSGATQDVVVKIDPQTASADGLGVSIWLDMVVEDVENLYAFAVKVRFDPTVLRVRRVVPGDFLDYEHWLITVNRADNEAGLVELAITQTGQTPGQDGTGVLGSVIFEGISEGTSEVRFEEIDLRAIEWPYTQLIPSVGQSGTVTIGSGWYWGYLPIIMKSYP